MFWFAQTPAPAAAATPVVQFETLAQAPTLGPAQMGLLGIYFLVCLALVICVTLSTNKSEGLMQVSLSAPTANTGKGKESGEERLSKLTSNLAYTFLGMSIFVAYFIKW